MPLVTLPLRRGLRPNLTVRPREVCRSNFFFPSYPQIEAFPPKYIGPCRIAARLSSRRRAAPDFLRRFLSKSHRNRRDTP